jgi:hypothetical protein
MLDAPARSRIVAFPVGSGTDAARGRACRRLLRDEPDKMRVAFLAVTLLFLVPGVLAAQSAYGRLGIGPSIALSLGAGVAWSHVEVGAEALVVETGQTNAYLGGTFSAVILRPELRFRPHVSASLLLAESFDYSQFAAVGLGAGVTARLTGWLAAYAEARYFLPLSETDYIDSQAAFLAGVRFGRTRRGGSTRDVPAAGPESVP